VKHIAEAHGGRAWVEDGAPRGSVFVLALDARGGRRSDEGADSVLSVPTR
jgi:signal transduction histidine kinase